MYEIGKNVSHSIHFGFKVALIIVAADGLFQFVTFRDDDQIESISEEAISITCFSKECTAILA